MLFSKKKRMVDVRELQKRGVVRIPEKEIVIPQTRDGFVELGASKKVLTAKSSDSLSKKSNSGADFFGFMDSGQTQNSGSQFSTEISGYNKREVDAKITELDNKIYKLEQRVELLERKSGVNHGSNEGGVIGW